MKWKRRRILAILLTAVLLAGSLVDAFPGTLTAYAESFSVQTQDGMEVGSGDGSDLGELTAPDTAAGMYRYVAFPTCEGLVLTVPEQDGIMAVEDAADVLYRIDLDKTQFLAFTASVDYGYQVQLSEEQTEFVFQMQERTIAEGKWNYRFDLDVSLLSDTREQPYLLSLDVSEDRVPVTVRGNGLVTGVGEDGMAQMGSVVSVEVLTPGDTLNLITEDEAGNPIYTAMELDYENRYEFTVAGSAEFVISDPDQVNYPVLYADSRKAKITGEAGIVLKNLASSAQGYNEIVLNFTAVKNGSDGTEDESVYYEVQVTAAPQGEETVPSGSPTTPVYYYIPKTENSNTQSKSIRVNAGNLSAPTACTYEFSVKMVQLPNRISVPAQDVSVKAPLTATLSGNTLTKSFSTKNLYYEDKLGFAKKSTKILTGQEDVLAGSVKYSKNASYIHDLTAVAYDGRGVVCDGISCTFRNDNDELYVSAESYIKPGKYKIIVYAGIGEAATADTPQGGTMYQSNTSFTLTVEPGINRIDTAKITDSVVLSSKNVTFSAVPVGYGSYGYNSYKAKSQKFTYEIMGAESSDYGYTVTEPNDNVKNNISVSKNGKVTVKKEYVVGTANNYTDYFAVVITAADFAGNTTTATKFVSIKGNAQTPSKIYLEDGNGRKISMSGNSLSAAVADGAYVVVEDQGGRDMTQYVTITPADNAKGTTGIYVYQSAYDGTARLYVRKCGKVTIKAVSKDGKKKTLSLKLEVTRPTSNRLVYTSPRITCDGMAIATKDSTWENGFISYGSPFKGVTICFSTALSINGQERWKNWYDWGYSMKGGKAKLNGNEWTVTPNAQSAELKIWLKHDPNRYWLLRFSNSKWGESYESAPKLKLVSGKLYGNKYTNAADLEYYEYEDGYIEETVPSQTVTYSYDYLSVRDIRYASVTKNAPYMSVSHNRENRTITLSLSPGNDIKPGSYKYKFALYDEYGYLYCKPMTITVKINKASAVKVTPSYTMNYSKKGEESVTLKCTPQEFVPDFDTQLLNANVGGKANEFNQYFELAYVTDAAGTKTVVIRFKSKVTTEQKEALKGKSLTGYVRYSYYFGYDKISNATSKVTIKIQ